MLNQTILHYQIQSELGKGGMATVYLAEDQKFKSPVAFKVLNKEFIHNEHVRKRFLEEARSLFRMSHPNIVKVTDLIEQEDTVAFAMEFIEGQTLREYINQHGKLSDAEIARMMKQMLEALNYVHQQQLIHRDIKPSNFMVDKQGAVKLMDFGVAKNTDANAAEYTQTGTGVTMGTPMYMSPEQITETKSVTVQSDIYSMGVVLWQMVTGKRPYDMQTLSTFQLQMKIVQDELPLTETNWDSVIRKATNKNDIERFKDCKEFEQAITAAHVGGSTDSKATLPLKEVEQEPIEEVTKVFQPEDERTVVSQPLKIPKENPSSTADATQVEIGSSQQKEEANTSTDEKARKPNIFLIGSGVVIIGLILFFVLRKKEPETTNEEDSPRTESYSPKKDNTNNSGSNSEDTYSEQEKKPSQDNSESEALQKEINNPSTYLSVRGSAEFRLVGRDVIDIMVVNNAEYATFGDITVVVDFYNSGEFNGSETFTLNGVVSPGYSESWSLKTDAPMGSDQIKILVQRANGFN
jgi:serine/threonine-protein kinase